MIEILVGQQTIRVKTLRDYRRKMALLVRNDVIRRRCRLGWRP